jgi:anti-sigma factor RsiW
MKYDDCANLDAFLLGDLSADETLRFTAHLDQCGTCRDAVEQQRWIDELLTSPIGHDLELPPGALLDSLRTTVVASRRQTRIVACVFAAAAVVAIAAGWTVLNRQASDVDAPGGIAVSGSGQIEVESPRATFVGGPEVLVVPVASRHPNVTIVRVYPTYQPSYGAQANAEHFDPDQFNGG